MKKATLQEIHDLLVHWDECPERLIEEISAELNKGAEEKAARAEAYEGIHSLVVDNLSDTPVTCADLYEEIKNEVEAQGMNRYKVQYALNNLWQNEIEKIPGKPNTYKRR